MKIKKILIYLFGWLLVSAISFVLIVLVYFEYKEIPIYNFNLAYKFLKGEQNYSQYENLAEKLGYKKDDKLLIIHADDLGLSNSVNNASFKSLLEGNVNSASVIMTSERIKEVAEFSKINPEIDFGIHLTVTSEWKFHKWDGVLDSKEIQSLINKDYALLNLHKFDKSIAYADRALAIDPNSWDALIIKCSALINLHKFDECII